jgi:signal transduction histidine kinase
VSRAALRERWAMIAPRRDDILLGAAFAIAISINLLTTKEYDGTAEGNVALLTLMCVPIAFRRTAPLGACIAFGAVAIVQTAIQQPLPDLILAIPALWLMLYSGAAFAPSTRIAAGVLVTGVTTVLVVGAMYDPDFQDIFFPVVFFAVAPWLAGRAVGHRSALARELQEKATRAEHERERRAEEAVADERTRIARELHDVVAHSVSVMVVQAGGARRIVERDPERAREAAVLIEQAGREALMEMRRLLGVLRKGDEDLAITPQPSMARVDSLVERARAAGLPVELTVEGTPAKLPAGVDLAAYRVIQEALTNTLKHAGPAPTRVLVRYGRRDLELEVANEGERTMNGSTDDGGHGLAGMEERVHLVGGEMLARPRPEGGFLVQARLPVTVHGA